MSKLGFVTKELLQKYVESGLTDKELAKILNCSISSVKYRRDIFNIPANIRIQGKNLSGLKFGKLTVVKENHRQERRIFWLCSCDCGNEKVVSSTNLVSGHTRSCGCLRWVRKELRYNWKGYKDITGHAWGHLISNAKLRKISFQITKEETYQLLEKQNFKCNLSGLPIEIGKNASVDRIDSSLGYFLKNIQWVHKDINIIKWDYSNEYFLELCNLVINNSNEDGCVEVEKNRSARWKGCGNISGNYWYTVQYNAKGRNIDFNVTIDYVWDLFIKQKGKCAISGLPLCFEKTGCRKDRYTFTASLDRKDSSIGYSNDNVWWVHKDINNIKWKLDFHYFKYLCLEIAKKQANVFLEIKMSC